VNPAPSRPPRRLVTGHAADGRAVVLSDGPPPVARTVPDGATFHELWCTRASPAPLAASEKEPTHTEDPLGPPAGGTRVRLVEMPPGGRSPLHRTETVDYGIVLAGTVTLVLSDCEHALGAGDVVVQRGTIHAWENRGTEPWRMLFVLVDGRFDGELADPQKSSAAGSPA
jgi:naringenin degradation protein FdeH